MRVWKFKFRLVGSVRLHTILYIGDDESNVLQSVADFSNQHSGVQLVSLTEDCKTEIVDISTAVLASPSARYTKLDVVKAIRSYLRKNELGNKEDDSLMRIKRHVEDEYPQYN